MASAAAAAAAAFLLLLVASVTKAAEEPLSLLERQEAQLRRLEAAVDSLSAAVGRLQEHYSPCTPPAPYVTGPDAGHRSAAGVAVTKHKPAWSERFQFAAAARLSPSSSPSAASTLPYEDLDGLTKYFALGDSLGHSFIFSSSGDLLIQLPSFSDSPVTAILSYLSSNRKNESFLFVGHEDGSIGAHRLFESASANGGGDDWLTLSLAASRPVVQGARDLGAAPPVVALESHQAGRARYVVAADAGGRVRIFTENGTLYGTAIATSKPLAFVRGRLLFLTESGAALLDLRSMSIKETECEGLNSSLVKTYSFDVSERSKAYGITTNGDLIHVLLLGDAGNLKCRVRAIRKSEIDGPVAIQNIKGYLLVVNHEKVLVYNVSSQFYGRVGAPRLLFFATLQEIKSLFLNMDPGLHGLAALITMKPLIAADREKLVILGLGDGYVGIYRANFPVFKAESNAVVWSGPALLFLLFLIGIWQFYVKKKDALGWTPEEAFNTSAAPVSSLLGPGPSDRSFVDQPRPSDLRDMRGSGLRGPPPRRYASPPSRYPGGSSGIPFRPSTADPSFRGTADLTYRGQNIETSAFPKRREPLFPSTQVVDDHTD